MIERLAPQSAFADMWPTAAETGVRAIDCDGCGLASMLLRKGRLGELCRRVRDCFGIELPRGPFRVSVADVAFIGLAPDAWLVIQETRANLLAARLMDCLGPLVAVADQTDAYGVLRLTGPRVHDALSEFFSVDLHPQVFRPGFTATTRASHIPVTLCRLEDLADRSPVYQMAVPRSFCASLAKALQHSFKNLGIAHQSPG